MRSSIAHQDSLDDVPDINNSNQDVSEFSKNVCESFEGSMYAHERSSFSVHSRCNARAIV